MKYINPIEAKLIDSASGIHIKFRLAGVILFINLRIFIHSLHISFSFYILKNFQSTSSLQQFTIKSLLIDRFKIFAPTVDLKYIENLFIKIQFIIIINLNLVNLLKAPRDYTKQYLKLPAAKLRHNKIRTLPTESLEGWYKRIENNGWRPVSNKHLHQMNLDYYYGTEKCKPIPVFQHSKLVRKQEIEAKRKQKKIEWMQKMYKAGILRSKSDDPETNELVEDTAKNLLNSCQHNNGGIEDWEVDQLIDWTNALDFGE